MRIKHLLSSVAVALAATVALADEPKKAGQAVEKAAAALPFDDAEFIKKAVSGGMHEVALGKYAAEHSKNDGVKQFGEKMQTDHTNANLALLEIAKAHKVTVEDKMNEKDQKEVDKFKAMTGDEFDKAYVEHMVKDHEHDIKEFKRASQEAKDPALKEFATKTLPTLEEHLAMVKKLQK